MKKILLIICSLVFLTGARLYHEKEYQLAWCKEGKIEYVLSDRTRVDCLLDDVAVEFDFANKWAEAIGQSLHYSLMTKRTPGVVLIIEKDSDWKYYRTLERINNTFNLGIQLRAIGPDIIESNL